VVLGAVGKTVAGVANIENPPPAAGTCPFVEAKVGVPPVA
jgi:hypothetical protein